MADRYWVGGTANWDGTAGTKWATTSGGAGGAAVPTSADNVFFDANSGANTVTVGATVNCADLTFTGFTGTFAGSSTVNIYGSLLAVSGMTWTQSRLSFGATTSGKTITTAGKLATTDITFNGSGGIWTLQDAINTTGSISLDSGTLDTNNYNIDCGSFRKWGGTLTLGSTILTASANNIAFAIDLTGGPINAGTSTIKAVQGGFGTIAPVVIMGSYTLYNLEVYGNPSTNEPKVTFLGTGTTTFNNLKLAPTAGSITALLYGNVTVNGTFTSTGSNAGGRNLFSSQIRGTQRTITAAVISIQDTDFRDINAAGGAAPWALSGQRVGDCTGNTSITFPSPVTRYAVSAGNWSSTAVWSSSSGGVSGASVPLPQDTAVFDASTGAGTYTLDTPRLGTLNAAALGARNVTLSSNLEVYGSFALSSSLTFSVASYEVYFVGIGTNTLNSVGKSFFRVYFGGNYKLASNFVCSSTCNFYGGVFEAISYNVTATAFTLLSTPSLFPGQIVPWMPSNNTVYLGSGTWTTSATGTCWNYSASASMSLFSETSTIDITATGANTFTFAGGGQIYNNLRIIGGSGASVVVFSGSNTFSSVTNTKSVAFTIRFTASTTTTANNWGLNGSSGNLITLDSTSAGTRFNIAKSGSAPVVLNFVSVKDSNATTANTFYAVNSTNAGNNVNWSFNFPPSLGNMMAFFN